MMMVGTSIGTQLPGQFVTFDLGVLWRIVPCRNRRVCEIGRYRDGMKHALPSQKGRLRKINIKKKKTWRQKKKKIKTTSELANGQSERHF